MSDSKVLIKSSYLTEIANAIREQNSSSNTYTPSEMPQAILDLSTAGGELAPLEEVEL